MPKKLGQSSKRRGGEAHERPQRGRGGRSRGRSRATRNKQGELVNASGEPTFRQCLSDILDLAQSSARYSDKRVATEARALELGGKVGKKQKVPANILRGMVKKAHERREKQFTKLQEEEGRNAKKPTLKNPLDKHGLHAMNIKRRDRVHKKSVKGRAEDGVLKGTRGINETGGKFRNGVLFVDKPK